MTDIRVHKVLQKRTIDGIGRAKDLCRYGQNTQMQSYVIKSAPWTILWFRILGIFSVENIKRLCFFMFQTWDNSQLLRRVLWISAEQPIGASLKHKNTQPLYIFNRVRVLHLNRLKERTWLHSFVSRCGHCWHVFFNITFPIVSFRGLVVGAKEQEGARNNSEYQFEIQFFR